MKNTIHIIPVMLLITIYFNLFFVPFSIFITDVAINIIIKIISIKYNIWCSFNNNGKVESVDERGTQKLAYPIKKKEEGYYVVIIFEAKPDSIDELERNYRIEDNIMKFIVVRKEK